MKILLSVLLLAAAAVLLWLFWVSVNEVPPHIDTEEGEEVETVEEPAADAEESASSTPVDAGTEDTDSTPPWADTVWVWVETVQEDGTGITPNEPDAFTLTFTATGRVSGTTDCNNFSGQYEIDGDELTIGPLAATLMYCEGSQEQHFTSSLAVAKYITIDDTGQMRIKAADESETMILNPAE